MSDTILIAPFPATLGVPSKVYFHSPTAGELTCLYRDGQPLADVLLAVAVELERRAKRWGTCTG